MSAREFVDAWRAGSFGDPDENLDALALAMLLPLVGEDTALPTGGLGDGAVHVGQYRRELTGLVRSWSVHYTHLTLPTI